MEKVKRLFLSKYSLFLSMILGLVGIQISCTRAEYGTPSATYKVNGSIKSDSTGKAIPNIKVTMLSNTVYSDANGNYNISLESGLTDQVHISCYDVDDTTHGSFQNKNTLVDFHNAIYTNGDGEWYKGETSKTINIKLKPKN